MISTSSFLRLAVTTTLFVGLATAAQPAEGTSYALPVQPNPNHYVPGTIDSLAPGTNTTASIVVLYRQMLGKGDAPSGALWLTKGNGQQLYVSYGNQSLDAGSEPFPLNNHIRIGSITKTFTGFAILKLVKEGKLSLDDVSFRHNDLMSRHV
jgi:CubicO group peptidase (beta-lactamase class C family)